MMDDPQLITLGKEIIEQKKSAIQVQQATNYGDFPFFTSGESVLLHDTFLVDNENIYLSTGGRASIKYYNGKAAYSTDTYVIKGKDISTQLIYYLLLNKSNYIDINLFTGSGLKHLQKDELKKLKFSIPNDSKAQKNIVEILTTTDQAIDQTEQLIAKYQLIKTGLMQDLLSYGIDERGNIRGKATHKFVIKNGIEVPNEWEVEPLGEILKIIDCKHVTPQYVDEGMPLIRPRNIKPDGLVLDDIVFVTEADFNFLMDKHKPKHGDIVFTRNASFGVSSYITEITQFAIGQDVVIMTPNEFPINTYFIFLLLNSILLKQIMNASAGSTFGRINLKLIRNLKTIVPPPEEQNKIADRVSSVENLLSSERQKLNKLNLVKTGLMQDLLSGNVRVN